MAVLLKAPQVTLRPTFLWLLLGNWAPSSLRKSKALRLRVVVLGMPTNTAVQPVVTGGWVLRETSLEVIGPWSTTLLPLLVFLKERSFVSSLFLYSV